MPGFGLIFLSKLRRRCYCLLCRLPMRDPVQITSCGHRFCDVCLQEYLSAGNFQCPEDDNTIDYAKIYPDSELQTEIMNSHIRCRHYKEGCRWVDKLQNLQAHMDICRYDAVPCPNRCSAKLSPLSLEDHLEYTCSKRKTKCEFCTQEFNAEYFDNTHYGNCPKEVVWCENKCGAKLERRYLSNHMKNECHKRTVSCNYCSREFVQETLQTHQYQCPRFPVACPNRCDPTKIPREEMNIHVQEICPSATVSCPFKEAGCKYKSPRFNMDRHLEESTKAHLQFMCNLVKKQQNQISQLCTAVHAVTHVTDGTFIWKISNYKAKYIEACYKNNMKELISQPFYTSRFGYKAALSVFLNGNGQGEGKFLSAYIKLLPGEYDNILDWPFMLPVSFTVYDQCSDPDVRANITESFVPDPTWKHFQKPCKDIESLGFGYPKFVSHDVLKTRDYIRDDSIIIKVCVDNKRFILP
ncbi:TNF receptor-associated factor 4-like isoform X2 [Gigantopelta aegis]|uniref:TNF receptor-associated factor 4-like isoform X2 n=1 Tax=Gigantopelta aegis TaxID=1735272 RepID=UPI001B888422|nr:TNF receptor-associated factor 4-like isoform X2 [Gigantopelta aegis]